MKLNFSDPSFCWCRYALKKHHATRLHYDLRLEWNGVLLSWALPMGPSLRPGEPREAIQMEDHRLANLLFEGLHDTGPIMLWDRGMWAQLPGSDDVETSLANGSLRFMLFAERLFGAWSLRRDRTRKSSSRDIWTLRKEPDSSDSGGSAPCALELWPNSVSTGRSMQQICGDWINHPRSRGAQTLLF